MRFWKQPLAKRRHIQGEGFTFADGPTESDDLTWVDVFSFMLSEHRSVNEITTSHVVGAIYIVSAEIASKFWRTETGFERMVVNEHIIHQPRWFYWIDAYEILHLRKGRGWFGKYKRWDLEVREVREIAREIASRSAAQDMTPMHLLFAIASAPGVEIGTRLRASGLETDKLEAYLGEVRLR